MRTRKPKTRKAWLVTWESSRDDYLRELNRPRVVAILRPQLKESSIRRLLPALYISEKKLRFSEKIDFIFGRQSASIPSKDENSICCGGNPWLCARLVEGLYVQSYPKTLWRETLYWIERGSFKSRKGMVEPVIRQRSEDVHFDKIWDGRSSLDDSV